MQYFKDAELVAITNILNKSISAEEKKTCIEVLCARWSAKELADKIRSINVDHNQSWCVVADLLDPKVCRECGQQLRHPDQAYKPLLHTDQYRKGRSNIYAKVKLLGESIGEPEAFINVCNQFFNHRRIIDLSEEELAIIDNAIVKAKTSMTTTRLVVFAKELKLNSSFGHIDDGDL